MRLTGHIAVDLGAESGRVIVGVLDRSASAVDGKLRTHEVRRFEHHPLRCAQGLLWDTDTLWREILRGLRAAVEWSRAEGVPLLSVGVDTWGVDFALIDQSGKIVVPPRCYRDESHFAALPGLLRDVPERELYNRTGIRTMAINSLSQLRARVQESRGELSADRTDVDAPNLARASHLLFMPDLFHFWLSGVRANEASIASTSQMLHRSGGAWDRELLSRLNLPHHFLGELLPPGSKLGPVRGEAAARLGLTEEERTRLLVVTPASHDTGSAVAAIPAAGGSSWAFLSSGTWSLLGIELAEPIVSEEARLGAFTNERGAARTIRFLKNIVGLWLVQECRREFETLGQTLSYADLTRAAGTAKPFETVLDPDHPPFLQPGGMLGKIRDFARRSGQPEPGTPGAFARCCFESLALSYRTVLASLERVTGRQVSAIHVVGGGGKNRLLNQMTADACARRVLVGPLEATAVGNVMVQAIALGLVEGLAEAREIVGRSVVMERFEPTIGLGPVWTDAERRLAGVALA